MTDLASPETISWEGHEMVSMKTAKCPTCGGIVFKLTGKAAKLCHDECLDCRKKRAEQMAAANISVAALTPESSKP